jgi:hypothetical protein
VNITTSDAPRIVSSRIEFIVDEVNSARADLTITGERVENAGAVCGGTETSQNFLTLTGLNAYFMKEPLLQTEHALQVE